MRAFLSRRIAIAIALCSLAGAAGAGEYPAPVGPEFQVNSYTSDSEVEPDVSCAPGGAFVVTWEAEHDGDESGIFAQLFDSTGMPLGGEFQVNTTTTADQADPAISHDPLGNFVIVWQSMGQDGSDYGVFAQRFDSAGTKLGGEILVNTVTANRQFEPAISHDPSGEFVVVWTKYPDGSYSGIRAQRFSSLGVKLGAEISVNTFVLNHQNQPAVSHDDAGNWLAAWRSTRDAIALTADVNAQLFNSLGIKQGGEFWANSYTTGQQVRPTIAHGADGEFVIAWQSAQDGSDYGVFAQRFNSSGVKQGGEWQVNTHTSFSQTEPRASSDAAGRYLLLWESMGQDGSDQGIFGQRLDGAGNAIGLEFRANEYATGKQDRVAVAHSSANGFVVVWNSDGQDGYGAGVFGRRFTDNALVVGGAGGASSTLRRWSSGSP